jgi:hypothetical protein
MAVDGNGNIYVTDGVVQKIPTGCADSTCVTTLGGGFFAPYSVAVDGSGNVYVTDLGTIYASIDTVKMIPTGCTAASCVTTLGSGFSGPNGVAVDGSGNVYVADTGNGAVKKIDRTASSDLSFVTPTQVGTMDVDDGAQIATIQNIGNAALSFQIPGTGSVAPLLSSTGNFVLDGSGTCPINSGGSLPAGASCTLAIRFTPQIDGVIHENATLTDDNLNWTPTSYAGQHATQTIPLSGRTVRRTPTITVDSSSAVYGAETSVMLTASIAYDDMAPTGAVTFTVNGNTLTASCTGASSPLTCTASYSTSALNAGSYTIAATIAADANYVAAASNPGTLTINRASQTITGFAATPANPTYASGGTFTVSASGGNSGQPVTFTSATPNVCTTGGANGATITMVAVGNCTIHADQAADNNGNYLAAPQASLTVILGAMASSSITGAWYDPDYNGSGFNVTLTPYGLLVYYYGWDKGGNRLWLSSDTGSTSITPGNAITLPMYETHGGTFDAPAGPDTAKIWGSLQLNFSSDGKSGTATLTGDDGTLNFKMAKLIGMTSAASVTGAWYDQKYNGSGFNLLMTDSGLLLYYYGWDKDGNRLWLSADFGPKQIVAGTPIKFDMVETNGGTFTAPAGPETQTLWGTLELNFSNDSSGKCNKATATLTGKDGGPVTLDMSMLAGVLDMPPGC